MPYFFEVLTSPLDDDHFWQRLEEIWRVMHDDMMGVHFETEEEALEKVYLKSLHPDNLRLDSLFVARYRTTDDRENLLLFHERGLEVLETTEAVITKQEMSAQFMNDWSELLSCHGFVTAAVMARGPDLEHQRALIAAAQANSVEEQRQWFAHYYLRARVSQPTRDKTEDIVLALINAAIDGSVLIDDRFSVAWFEKFLNLAGKPQSNSRFGQLTKSFRQKALSEKEMRRLVQLPSAHLPPLDLEFPPSRKGGR